MILGWNNNQRLNENKLMTYINHILGALFLLIWKGVPFLYVKVEI